MAKLGPGESFACCFVLALARSFCFCIIQNEGKFCWKGLYCMDVLEATWYEDVEIL